MALPVVGITPLVASAATVSADYILYLHTDGSFHKDNATGDDVTADMASAGAVVTGGPGARILTLTSFDFETSAEIALQLNESTTIVLVGANALTSGASGTINYVRHGINSAAGTLTINGSGSLTVTSGAATTNHSCGIMVVSRNLTINGSANVTSIAGSATGGAYASSGIWAGNIEIGGNATVLAEGGAITPTAIGDSFGLRAIDGPGGISNITISGSANVTAIGGAAKGHTYGISAASNVTISGGTVNATSGNSSIGNNSYGIRGTKVEITGGTVNTNGGNTNGGASAGIQVSNTGSSVAVSGSANVTAKGSNTTSGSSYGIYGDNTASTVTVSGNATVTATGGKPGDGSRDSAGIYTESSATISGGTVSATGDAATGGSSYGIRALSNVAVSGSANVTAASGTGSNSYGIRADSSVTVSGGTVAAVCGGAAGLNSYGIYAGGSGLAASGGTVTATSAERAIYNNGSATGGGAAGSFDFTVPNGYKYWVATDTANTTGQQNGTSDGTFAIKLAHKYAKFQYAASSPVPGPGGGGGGGGGGSKPAATESTDTVEPAGPSNPEPMKPYNPAGTEVDAVKTNNPLIIDGEQTDFPAVKIDGWNWLKLRDLALLLNGTSKQFSISYDKATNTIIITTGGKYEPIGDELLDMLTEDFTALASGQKIMFNRQLIEVAAYNIDGYNYFRLRDLMILLDVLVIYDEATGEITLDLSKPYSE